jgi:regulatory protein
VRFRAVRRAGIAAGDIHEVALRMLGRRALSRAEVLQRLERRAFPPSAVRAEIARLERAGLLDELALARAVCQAQIRAGRGRRAIAGALRRRLVGKDAAAQALDEVIEGDESVALSAAFTRVAAKHRFWRRLPEERRKVVRYLLARGFSLDQVRRVMQQPKHEEDMGAEGIPAEEPDAPPAGSPHGRRR